MVDDTENSVSFDTSPDEEDKLFNEVPKSGISIGNKTLREKMLSSAYLWNEESYWRVRNALVTKGRIKTGRGKGGSVMRVPEGGHADGMSSTQSQKASTENSQECKEADLYPDIFKNISEWARGNLPIYACHPHRTDQGGRRRDGKWMRPDISLATVMQYRHIPEKKYELVTFEVKIINSCDLTAVYEALAHRRFAHRAYVFICNKEGVDIPVDILGEAEKQGIGVINAKDVADSGTWDVEVEAKHHEPDFKNLDEFLENQVDLNFRLWVKHNWG